MNAALIRGRRSLIFLLSYAALNQERRFIGVGAFLSKYGKSFIVQGVKNTVSTHLGQVILSVGQV